MGIRMALIQYIFTQNCFDVVDIFCLWSHHICTCDVKPINLIQHNKNISEFYNIHRISSLAHYKNFEDWFNLKSYDWVLISSLVPTLCFDWFSQRKSTSIG